MWSSSFAGSICARISAIGFGDGLGVGVGRSVAVGETDGRDDGVELATAAVGDGVSPNEPVALEGPGTGPHAANTITSSAARALILSG